MARELTIENLGIMADLAGLNLSADELRRLLPGVNRSKKQAAELRDLVATGDEPAASFTVAPVTRK